MKKILLIALFPLLIFCADAKAQFVYDELGRPAYEISYTDIGGSPYIQADWAAGSVILHSGKQASAQLKFDTYSNRLLFQGKNAEPLEFTDNIKGFSLNISDKEISDVTPLIFINNLPAIDKQTTVHWYQLIADGKVKLLKYYGNKIVESQAVNFNPKTKSFKAFQVYYILQNDVMVKISPNKKGIIKALSSRAPEIEAWLKTHLINFKSDADLQKLFEWYNSQN